MPSQLERFSPPPPTPGPSSPAEWGPPPPPSGPTPSASFYPLTIGRGVSLAFHLFRFGWRTFVGISLVVFIPVVIVEALAQYATFSAISEWEQRLTGGPFGGPSDPSAVLTTFPIWAYGVIVLAAFVAGPFSTVGAAALIDAIVTAIRGGRLSARRSFRAALGRLRSLLGLYLILTLGGIGIGLIGYAPTVLTALPSALGVSGGLLALLGLIVFVAVVFAFIFFMIRIAFALQALIIEDLPVAGSLRRSWALLAGSMLRLMGWMIALTFVAGLLALVFEICGVLVAFIVSPPHLSTLATFNSTFGLTFAVVLTVFSGLGAAIVQPVILIGSTLLYFEIRWRHGESVPVPGQPQADPVHSG